MIKLLATLICSILPAISHADSLSGFIQKSAGTRFLDIENDDGSRKWLRISTTNPRVQLNLNMLKAGDYLIARGEPSADGKSVEIEAIESLGLNALLGAWTTNRNEVYDFRDFSRLTLYVPSGTQKKIVVKAGDFDYAVTPDHGSRYSIFLSGHRSVHIGSIEFRKSRLMLKVVDPLTGEVSSELSLSPLAGGRSLK